MAEKTEKEPKVKKKKGRAKGPKLVVGDFPYVSLMPINRLNAIEVEEAKTKWVKTVGAGVVIAIVISIAALGFKVINQLSYDGAQQNADKVETSILQYKDVDRALSIKQSIEQNIVSGTKNSINWSEVYNRISQNLPEGSSITSFDVATGGGIKDKSAITVYLNISSLQPIAYAQISDAFNQVPGIISDDVIIGNLTGGGEGNTYTYPIAFNMDPSVLSTRWESLTNPAGAASESDQVTPEAQTPEAGSETDTGDE